MHIQDIAQSSQYGPYDAITPLVWCIIGGIALAAVVMLTCSWWDKRQQRRDDDRLRPARAKTAYYDAVQRMRNCVMDEGCTHATLTAQDEVHYAWRQWQSVDPSRCPAHPEVLAFNPIPDRAM